MRSLHVGVLLAQPSGFALASTPPDLFTEMFAASQPTPPRTQAAFPATVNFAALNANPASITLELPGAGTFIANRVRFEQRPGGGYHWIGKTLIHDVILTVNDDIITGFVRGGPDTFSVLTTSHGPGGSAQSIHRMDASAFPSDVVDEGVAIKGASPDSPARTCFGKEFQPIDVLLVYSHQALAAAGGDVAVLENELFNAAASANVTLQNSNVPTFLSIVGIELAPATLNQMGNLTDLTNARNNAQLLQRRRDLSADVVTYITSAGQNSGTPYCGVTRTQRRPAAGIAYFGMGYDFYDSAVQVVTWQCGVQNNDLSHEIGHNAGLDHNPPVFAVRPPAQNLYPFAYGYEVNGMFRDDMSGINATICPDGCPRQMFFSDPAQTFLSGARGTASKNNAQVYRQSFRCLNTFAEVILSDGFE